jgi:hypothetical protein
LNWVNFGDLHLIIVDLLRFSTGFVMNRFIWASSFNLPDC